jgi:hypothetical protein
MRILIALVVWAGAVVGAVAVSNAVSSSIHNQTATVSTSAGGVTVTTGGGSTSGPDPSSIKSTDSASLFRTANFEKALAKARAALGANVQVENFALYPGYLTVIADKGGNEIDYYVDANGNVQQSATGASPGGTGLLHLSQIAAAAPAGLANRIHAKAHLPESQLHYMVAMIDPITGHGLAWFAYTKQGNPITYFESSGAGGQLREQR